MVSVLSVKQCGKLCHRVTSAIARTTSSIGRVPGYNHGSNASISRQPWSWKPHLKLPDLLQRTQTGIYALPTSDTQLQSFSSVSRLLKQTGGNEEVQEPPEFKAFYRLPSIVGLRILSRVKIAQTCLTIAILPPLSYYHSLGVFTTSQLQFAIGVATFALFMLYAMSFYLRRVIGAMYLHRDGDLVKISHLTFWGKRQDMLVPVEDIVPLGEGSNRTGEVLMKFERYSTRDVFYFTPRFGYFVDPNAFLKVFGKP